MRTPPSRSVLVAILIVLGVSAATVTLEWLGLFDRFETARLDTLSILQSRPVPINIVIVTISQEDYATSFNSTSPLACGVLETLVTAIASANPEVIGVDLDTSDRKFACLRDRDPSAKTPIVWAEDAAVDPTSGRFTAATALTGLGPASSVDKTGIAVLPLDRDGIVRSYVRTVDLQNGGSAPSFVWALLQTCCRATTDATAESGTLRLNFSGDRFTFLTVTAGSVLSAATGSAWKGGGAFAGKIVLLGGTYREARDVQVTPVGVKPGVEILAQAVASEIDGRGIRPMNRWTAFGLDVALGFLLVYINIRLRRRLGFALLISLIVIPVACLAASMIAFYTVAYWVEFTPIVGSVMLHQLFEHGREYQRLHESEYEDPPEKRRHRHRP